MPFLCVFLNGFRIDFERIWIPEMGSKRRNATHSGDTICFSLKTFVEIENGDKKVSATPVLNLAVSVDSRAAGFARGRQFARIFEEFMTEL